MQAELAELRAAASSTAVVLADKDRRIAELSRALQAAQQEAAASKQEVEGLRSAHDKTGDLQLALEEAQEQAQVGHHVPVYIMCNQRMMRYQYMARTGQDKHEPRISTGLLTKPSTN